MAGRTAARGSGESLAGAWTSCESPAGGTADAGGRDAGPSRPCLSPQGGHASLVRPIAESRATDAGDAARIRFWVGDLTYLGVGGRWWYLVGGLGSVFASGARLATRGPRDSRLTRTVVDAALRRRTPAAGLIFHSDRGSEFLGRTFRARLTAERRASKHDARGGAGRERPHGIVLSLAQSGCHSRAIVSRGRRAPRGSCDVTSGTTTISGCIRRWDIGPPLTMNGSRVELHVSTENEGRSYTQAPYPLRRP